MGRPRAYVFFKTIYEFVSESSPLFRHLNHSSRKNDEEILSRIPERILLRHPAAARCVVAAIRSQSVVLPGLFGAKESVNKEIGCPHPLIISDNKK